uniref:DNA mismatch repair proteins mutS family domain-containing protein n=1 Tax=Timema bartmani TaxID=61472 RepID=A0A7R9I3V6_9NEOP|nr:unnamed protein product [Timema bartmani]
MTSFRIRESPQSTDVSSIQMYVPLVRFYMELNSAGRGRVLALRLPSEPEDSSEDEHTLYMNMLINFRAESMVLALGTLLKYLDKAWVTLSLQNTWTSAPVLVINTVSLADIVMVDAETYEALQIFSQRMHPSSFKMWTPGSSREGLSIYGLFNRCKVMLLHPTKDIDILNDRLDLISFCLQPRYEEAVKNMTDCLKHLKSITIASCEISDLYKLTYCITRVVDFPESEKQKKVVVQLGLDEELDRKKQTHGGLSLLLNQVADLELKDLPLYIQACSMIYIPEIGFLVALPFWKDCMQTEDFQIQSLELMFIAGEVAHYKTKRCRELDSTLGDILLQISEQESRIILKLVDFVQEKLLPLHEILKLGAELDCLIALAAVAKENGYCRPTLTRERVLDIVDGRHPLQEMCVDSFVPNDTRSSSEHGLMKLLTGPNASGKSIYLKQVALISYLAHVGSFVSATSATIGILDHIHTRIQTVESIATQLSAFMIDLKQMALSLYCSTPSSLIIIDEFGKGTSEVDGLALLVSCLRHYLSREENCPHVFVSTHFHQVCEMLPRTKYLMFQNLEYMLDRDDQIVYLFKLKEGSVMSSFALIVAESLGAGSAAKRAQEVLVAMRVGEDIKRNPDCKMTLKQAQ